MADTPVDLDFKTMQQVAACGYEAIRRKGRGTYGFVYEVGDAHGDLFAFKYILPDESYTTFGLDSLNEVDILSRVQHPYIIHSAKIITSKNCQIDGMAIVLPLADRTLYDIIKDPMMTTENKLPLLYKLATALEFLHRSQILHLDIKSTNVVLQGDTPYFIDFGLSMVVDNASIGKYDHSTRVTIDHRAPEILSGGRIYNSAVDVWAFGIMLLYILSGRGIFNVDFATITPENFYYIVVNMFANPKETLDPLLSGVRPQYRDLCVDLLSKILQLDPTIRLTAAQICNHPLFDEFRQPVDGYLENPPIHYNYPTDHRDILKLMIHWGKTLYPTSRAELLFLAVDLFNRMDTFYKDREPINRMSLAATCLWLAAKLTNSISIPLDVYVPQLTKMVPNITSDMILNDEIEIVSSLSGILNVSNLYFACSNADELIFTFTHVILDRDSTLYARTDIPGWIQTMKGFIPNPIHKDKNITITELLS